MIFNDVLISLDEIFKIPDDKVLFNEFISSFSKDLDSEKLEYKYIEEIFKVKLDKKENFFSEFRRKVLRLKEHPYYKYYNLKQKRDSNKLNIETIIKKLENQISELEMNKEKLEREVDEIRGIIGKKKWSCEECDIECSKLRKYTLELLPNIVLKIRKCKQYKSYLNNEIAKLESNWNEKKIKEASFYNNIDNLFIEFSNDLFDKETNYNISVKVAIHTEKMIERIKSNIANMSEDIINEYILMERNKNKYSTELMESLYLNNKEKYYELLKEFMEEENILELIVSGTKESFFISHRIKVIKDIKLLYENGSYQSCICLIPLQIEGILHDYCEELGIVPNSLNNFTIGTKITEIEKVINFYLGEYINYNMQIIRNKIAHGLLYKEDLENICTELILDLATLIYFLNTEENVYSNELRNFLFYYKDKSKKDWYASNFNLNNEFIKINSYILNEKIGDKRNSVIKGRMKLIFSNRGKDLASYYNCLNELEEIRKLVVGKAFLQNYRKDRIDTLSKFTHKSNINKQKQFIKELYKFNLGKEEKNIIIDCNKKLRQVEKEILQYNEKSKIMKENVIMDLRSKLLNYGDNNYVSK